MRLVPDTRILVWLAILLPFAVLGALAPAAAGLSLLLFGVLAGLALVDAALAPSVVRAISVSTPETVRFSKDRAGVLPLQIHGAAGRTLRLGLAMPPSFAMETEFLDVCVPAEEGDASVDWVCTPSRRGLFDLRRCYFELRSPCGFWRVRGNSECRTEIRVYPNLFDERRRLASIFLRRGHLGAHMQRTVGPGKDFEKLREYIPGDSYDDIHWKATAKRGRPVTKLYQVERTQEIYVAIDASRLAARNTSGTPNLERMIVSALTLGLVARQQGDRFGLIAFNDRVRRFVRAAGGKTHYSACRDALYTLTSGTVAPDYQEFFSFVRLRLRRRSLIFVLADIADPVLAESFLEHVEIISRQHLVMVCMTRPEGVQPLFSAPDADSPDDLYRNLGGHMVWRSLEELQRALRHRGVDFSLVDDERMSADMVAHYMRVKARQVL